MNRPVLPLNGLLAAVAVCCLTLAAPKAAMARAAEVYTPALSSLALKGYDPVSYFDVGRPVKGDPRFHLTWKGGEFRFASAEHLARFKANPVAFAPQFGGYCAWAIAEGHLASGDPLIWRLVGGKLYLNYDAKVQQRWAADIPGNIARANRNWPNILN
jgi:YHS domain-containing protein